MGGGEGEKKKVKKNKHWQGTLWAQAILNCVRLPVPWGWWGGQAAAAKTRAEEEAKAAADAAYDGLNGLGPHPEPEMDAFTVAFLARLGLSEYQVSLPPLQSRHFWESSGRCCFCKPSAVPRVQPLIKLPPPPRPPPSLSSSLSSPNRLALSLSPSLNPARRRRSSLTRVCACGPTWTSYALPRALWPTWRSAVACSALRHASSSTRSADTLSFLSAGGAGGGPANKN